MKYGLAILTLDNWPFVEITTEEFKQIKAAKTNLMVALAIEEKFEILTENYAEYERALLDLTLEYMIHQDFEWSSVMDHIQLVNRRIANLLTAAQLYIDQSKHDMATMFGRESVRDLKKKFDEEAAQSLGYRVMEEIRNHVQHRGLPVGLLAFPGDHHEEAGKTCVRFRIHPELDTDELRTDPGFDRSVLVEIEQQEDARDLTLMIRQFIAGLSRVHESVRDLADREVTSWTATFDNALETARTEIKHLVGLAAVEQDDEGNYCDKVYVLADLPKRVHEMRKRYRNLKSCSHWYVSSRVV